MSFCLSIELVETPAIDVESDNEKEKDAKNKEEVCSNPKQVKHYVKYIITDSTFIPLMKDAHRIQLQNT